jgi:alpha-tubulin suppressor-like RCC1 family protein
MLDKKNRVFTVGEVDKGYLGIKDEEIKAVRQAKMVKEGCIIEPVYITEGLPKPSWKKHKVIAVKAGTMHNIVTCKDGTLFSWGDGSFCRLGLGYDEEKEDTPS